MKKKKCSDVQSENCTILCFFPFSLLQVNAASFICDECQDIVERFETHQALVVVRHQGMMFLQQQMNMLQQIHPMNWAKILLDL